MQKLYRGELIWFDKKLMIEKMNKLAANQVKCVYGNARMYDWYYTGLGSGLYFDENDTEKVMGLTPAPPNSGPIITHEHNDDVLNEGIIMDFGEPVRYWLTIDGKIGMKHILVARIINTIGKFAIYKIFISNAL